MKKLLTWTLVLLLAFSVAGTALAANETGGSSTLTYTVAQTYTVTIPDAVTLGASAVEQTIPVTDVNIPTTHKINIAITATNQTNNAFEVAQDEVKIPYTVQSKVGDGAYSAYTLGTYIGALSAAGNIYFQYTRGTVPANAPSGDYTGTVTFTVTCAAP